MCRAVFASIASIAFLAGCTRAPARIEAPDWDPDDFADAILVKLDANKDGSLDKTELTAAPGLAFGAKYIDTDKNETLSREELVARFTVYKDRESGLTSKQMQLSYAGRPVAGAKVKLVPEFFLEGVVEPASGETVDDGTLTPITEGMDVPGVRAGYYRVVVESPRVKVPTKYTSAETTPLGVEVSPTSDDPSSYSSILQLVLRN
jgi:hypothetical protein